MASDGESENTTGATPATAALNVKNAFKTFAQQITLKLDENNFRSWKQQVEGIIRTHKLHRLLVSPIVPPRYLTEADRENDAENPAYVSWEQQDSLLFTWLLTTLSDSVLPRVVRCVHSHQIWDEIHKYMFAHTNAKSRQLCSELKSITKGEKTVTEYLARIQRIVDVLESIDDPISHRDQIEAILDGLPEEYNALASIIQYRPHLCPIIEAESMLLSHEAKLEKTKKSVVAEPISVNVAQATPPVTADATQIAQDASVQATYGPVTGYGDSRGGFHGGRGAYRGRGFHGGRGAYRGRGGRSGGRYKVQCQICHKIGHDASVCYHRHTAMMPNMWSQAQVSHPQYQNWNQ